MTDDRRVFREQPTHECVCGTFIRRFQPGQSLWIGDDGSTLCYPDAGNDDDRAATHEPYEALRYDDVTGRVLE